MASGPAGSKVDSSAPSRKKQHKDGGSQSAHTPRFCNGSSPSSAAPRPRPKGQTSRPPAPQYPFIPLKLFSSYLTAPPALGHCNMQYNVFFSGKNSFFLSLTKHLPLKLTLNHSFTSSQYYVECYSLLFIISSNMFSINAHLL